MNEQSRSGMVKKSNRVLPVASTNNPATIDKFPSGFFFLFVVCKKKMAKKYRINHDSYVLSSGECAKILVRPDLHFDDI